MVWNIFVVFLESVLPIFIYMKSIKIRVLFGLDVFYTIRIVFFYKIDGKII